MVRFTKWGIIGLAAALVAVLPVFAGDVPAASQARVVQNLGALPMAFEANKGQTDPQVLFQARGQGYGLFLTADEAVLSLMGDRSQKQPAVLRMRLAGSNPETGVSGLEALPGKVNYFIGKDRAKWRTDIPTFGKVRYANVYPGIDLVFYGTGRQLEFDFILKPGAKPEDVLMDFKGAESLKVSPEGDLVIRVSGGELRQRKPIVYQETPEGRKLLDGTFVAAGTHKAGFRVSGYDKTRILSIDPVLTYSSFLGGAGAENSNFLDSGIAVDGSGNAYVVGTTSSNPFPTTVGSYHPGFFGGTYDAFVTKVNAAGGAMLFSTYLGGTGDDFATSVALDGSNNVYVGGYTTSADLPAGGYMQAALSGPLDGFVAKLASTGATLSYCTYLGGTGSEYLYAIKVDSAGRAYVAGSTDSNNFPVVYPYQPTLGGAAATNAFVTRLNAACTYPPDFSTYLGGGTYDVAYGLALDGSGNAYVVGTTTSANFPTVSPFQAARSGVQDAFVTKLAFNSSTHTLSLAYSTYLGGSGFENAWSVAVDSSGNAYVAGETTSANYPLVNPFQAQLLGVWDATVTKFAPSGTSLVYSTYLGGTAVDGLTHIAVDGAGSAYVAGFTASTDFPTCNPITGYTLGGGGDVFYTKLNPAGNVMAESTRLGSTAADQALGVAVDASGNAYLTGVTWDTTAGGPPGGFPNAGGFQPTPSVVPDAFVTKLGPKTGCIFTCGASVPATGATGFPVNFTGTVTATGCGIVTYVWIFGDLTPNGATLSTTHIYAAPGTYAWTFTATDAGGNTCSQVGSIVIGTCALTCGTATVPATGSTGVAIPFSTTAATPVGACSGTVSYTWNFGDGGTGTGLSTTHTYATAGTFAWSMTAQVDATATCIESGTITIAAGCMITCTATVPAAAEVNTPVTFTGSATVANCVGVPIYAWVFGDGGTSSFLSTTHTYIATGTYAWTFTVTVGAGTCTKTGTITICSITCSAAVTPTTGFAPLTVNFAGADQPGCVGALAYDWNFGDGTAHSAAQQITHTYTAAGTYTWTMTATVNGLACTKTGTISVCALTCTATVPTTGKAGYPVAFASSSNLAYCTGTPTYLWVFGDGGTSVIPNPQHTYDHGGTYYWTLTVKEAGGTCTQSGIISISNPPIVAWLKARNQPDFNIVVKGSHLQPGIAVTINGHPVPGIFWKSTSKLVLESGPALKAIAPPNIPLQFHFVNPDGADMTVIWQYPL